MFQQARRREGGWDRQNKQKTIWRKPDSKPRRSYSKDEAYGVSSTSGKASANTKRRQAKCKKVIRDK